MGGADGVSAANAYSTSSAASGAASDGGVYSNSLYGSTITNSSDITNNELNENIDNNYIILKALNTKLDKIYKKIIRLSELCGDFTNPSLPTNNMN